MKIDAKLKENISSSVSTIYSSHDSDSSNSDAEFRPGLTSTPLQQNILLQRLGGHSRLRINRNGTQNLKQKNLYFTSEKEICIENTQEFSVISFWNLKKDSEQFKDLYKISQVVYGGACTQVKNERDFSVFSLIYNNLRTRLSPELLNAIFTLKCNLDLLDKINFL